MFDMQKIMLFKERSSIRSIVIFPRLVHPSQGSNGLDRGFMATTAIILLAFGTLAFSLTTMSAVLSFSDGVNRRELRIQARLNLKSCLDSLMLMAAKNYFVKGDVVIPEFGCNAKVTNDQNGNIHISVKAVLEGVSAEDEGTIQL